MTINYLNAVFEKTTLISEILKTEIAVLNSLKDDTLQTGYTTNTTFDLGVPSAENKINFQVRLVYSAELFLTNTKKNFCKYESETHAFFKIQNGYEFDFKNVSQDIMTPYFSAVHLLARKRAQEHFFSAGFPGIELPLPGNLNTQPNPEATN